MTAAGQRTVLFCVVVVYADAHANHHTQEDDVLMTVL